jgi:hypothetical protein
MLPNYLRVLLWVMGFDAAQVDCGEGHSELLMMLFVGLLGTVAFTVLK